MRCTLLPRTSNLEPRTFSPPLFSTTLFLSAALMFAVEPMIGKMLLPMVGGAPSGWLVAMAYFQVMLLAGYYLAHRLSLYSPRVHGLALCLVLALGIFAQPFYMPRELFDMIDMPESVRVFLLLTIKLTIPFMALAMLSPSLQRLFAVGTNGSDPYFLFAASNLGSFSGLLLYPIWMERAMGLGAQSRLWLAGYVALILLCALCVFVYTGKTREKSVRLPEPAPQVDWATRGRWMLLAFAPSSLMLGVTAHITVDIGAVPFFWVLPLALYLLTFVLAFARPAGAQASWLTIAQPVSVVLFVLFSLERPMAMTNLKLIQMFWPMLAFFMTALLAHFTLSSERPDPDRLTDFYLSVSAGGALGGIFNAFIAPFLFPLPAEFFFVLVMSCLFLPRPALWPKLANRSVQAALVVTAVAATLGIYFFRLNSPSEVAEYSIGVLLLVALLGLVANPRLLALTSAGLGLIVLVGFSTTDLREVDRNFFGVVRVYDQKQGEGTVRVMSHGSTLHGMQKIAPEIDTTPSSYFHPAGPLGDVMSSFAPRNVAIIGMGTASSICYQARGRLFTIYEIDPAVPPLAFKWFDYAKACGKPTVIIGDGRKELVANEGARYDLLIVDAFTSDAIPVHLLTREAVEEYMSRLEPDGVIAFHISNRFYDLRPPLRAVAQSLGYAAMNKNYHTPDDTRFGNSSDWVVVARNASRFAPLRSKGWIELPSSNERLWTDDYSNLLSALKRD